MSLVPNVHIAGLLSLAVLLLATTASAAGNLSVSYDGRSLIINGKRELLFSGSIHYPRSVPEVCMLGLFNVAFQCI